MGVARSVGDPGSARPTGLLVWDVSALYTRGWSERYCMALHCGCGELGYRVLLWFECDHLRSWDLLGVVYFGDASLPSVSERVDACDVLFVGEDPWNLCCGLLLLQWALRSSEFRRLKRLEF